MSLGFLSPPLQLPASNNSFPCFPKCSSLSSVQAAAPSLPFVLYLLPNPCRSSRKDLHPTCAGFSQSLLSVAGSGLQTQLFSKGNISSDTFCSGICLFQSHVTSEIYKRQAHPCLSHPCLQGLSSQLLPQEILCNCCSSRSPNFTHRRNGFPSALGNQQSSQSQSVSLCQTHQWRCQRVPGPTFEELHLYWWDPSPAWIRCPKFPCLKKLVPSSKQGAQSVSPGLH